MVREGADWAEALTAKAGAGGKHRVEREVRTRSWRASGNIGPPCLPKCNWGQRVSSQAGAGLDSSAIVSRGTGRQMVGVAGKAALAQCLAQTHL